MDAVFPDDEFAEAIRFRSSGVRLNLSVPFVPGTGRIPQHSGVGLDNAALHYSTIDRDGGGQTASAEASPAPTGAGPPRSVVEYVVDLTSFRFSTQL